MANKYLIHGATYCGDGTASNEAASAGAAGAWNDVAIFSNSSSTTATAPAYGTLAAGDIVNIRSKTSAGADIEISSNTASQYLGSQVATLASPIKWVLDNGAIWSGVSGTFKFTHSASNNNGFFVRGYNWLIAKATDGFTMTETRADHYGVLFSLIYNHGYNYIENLFIDASAVNAQNPTLFAGNTGTNFFGKNIRIKACQAGKVVDAVGRDRFEIDNLEIELTSASETFTGGVIYLSGSDAGRLVLNGGRIYGTGYSSNVTSIFSSSPASGWDVQLYGFNAPTAAPIVADSFTMPSIVGSVNAIGSDAGLGGFYRDYAVRIDSRNDGYYPTLNATLPTSDSDPWSWLVYPKNAAQNYTADVRVAKLYTSSAAAKKVTLEALVSTAFTTLDTANCHMEVIYVDDSTGLPKLLSTQEVVGGSLASSSAGWSATTYGAVSFNKKKFEVTTPTSIKQDTLVIAVLRISKGSSTASDILVVCPDLQLSTP